MERKPTNEELEQRVKKLERVADEYKGKRVYFRLKPTTKLV